jgi:simple sugar transport system ATP-binding protein
VSYLSMQGITRLYPDNGVLANDRVDFEARRGEIHALVGENGAGKTTLMKILCGLEPPDAGRIRLRGEEVRIRGPADAARLGIGMVHQHFHLIPQLSVAENVVLGFEPRRHGLFLDEEAAARRVEEAAAGHGFRIDPRRQVARLSVGQMQMVEVLKILYRRADLLILDEPTSVLAEPEVDRLFATLRRLSGAGKTVILISHKLGEVKEISDRITVMRRGRVVAVRETPEVDERELVRLMVGRSVTAQALREPRPAGPVVLELRGVGLRERGRDLPLLDGIDLEVRAGQIVGVVAVNGNGLAELEEVAGGLRFPTAGAILHDGEEVTRLDAAALRRRGLAYVPSDRLRRGASLQSTLEENLIVSHRRRLLKAGLWFDRGRVREFVRRVREEYAIEADPRRPMGTLSGGTIQKAILGRELAGGPRLAVFAEPARGLDVAGAEFLYGRILRMRRQGSAILLLSSDLNEVLRLADQVVVLYRGRIAARSANTGTLGRERIGEYMAGLRPSGRPGTGAP